MWNKEIFGYVKMKIKDQLATIAEIEKREDQALSMEEVLARNAFFFFKVLIGSVS